MGEKEKLFSRKNLLSESYILLPGRIKESNKLNNPGLENIATKEEHINNLNLMIHILYPAS